MIDLSVWHHIPSGQPIILEGEDVQDFCNVLDRLYEKHELMKARVVKLRSAVRITGAVTGDFGPHFGRRWTAEYIGAQL